MKTQGQKFIGFLLCFLIATPVFAGLEITEIMYNPDGVDDGYEYVKIKNTGASDVPISTYYFLENNTYHGLYPDSYILSAGDSAMVVKDIPTASARYGSQNYIKSSFSLNNTGETLVFADADKSTLTSFTYTSEMGGNGDGNPLYVNGSGSTSSSGSSSNSSSSSSSGSSTEEFIDYTPYYTGYIDIPDVVLARSEFHIQAGAIRTKGHKETLKFGGYYYLNFGDGYAADYRKRIDDVYTYHNPGVYTLVLEYHRGSLAKEHEEPDAFLEKTITVIEPGVSVTKFDAMSGLTVHNETSQKIDMAGWRISVKDGEYIFPEYSILRAGGDIIVPPQYLDFTLPYSLIHTVALINESSVFISSLDTRARSRKVKISTSSKKKNTESSVSKTQVNADIVLGSAAVLQEGTFSNDNTSEKGIVFREDDISYSALSEKVEDTRSNNTPLWLLAIGIMVLAIIKSVTPKPHHKKEESDEVYDIELID